MIGYKDLVNSYRNRPRDIRTKPVINRMGKWFYVYVENDKIVVDAAREHDPKCSISKPRVLFEKELDEIYKLYIQRKQGDAVSNKAMSTTRNQVYWYGIFSDIGL